MDSPEIFEDRFLNLTEQTANLDITSSDFTTAAKNLKLFADSRPPQDLLDVKPTPTTAAGKMKKSLGRLWESETTRALIKAGGAFAGVGLVVYSTIHRDHVIEKNSLNQANQKPA